MKSPLVYSAAYIPEWEREFYSELKVCQSAAGFYIGTDFDNKELGFIEPGSRESGYFDYFDDAAKFLKTLEELADPQAAAIAMHTHRYS